MRTWLVAATFIALAATGGAAESRPNIVFVLTDDLNARLLPHLPGLEQMLAEKGLRLQMTVSTPVCAPSRASILTGKYAHNHNVRTNGVWAGGIWALQAHGNEERTFAVWLRSAGYETGYFGKYMNGYESPLATVPPGWDAWVSHRTVTFTRRDFVSIESAGPDRTISEYDTDFFAAEASAFVASASEPFLAVFSPMSPHGPFVPAERHRDAFADTQFTWPPSFSGDVKWIAARTRTRLRMMLSVEEGIAQILATLEARGVLDRTYVFFTSDHGLFMGEHGFREGKGEPYEETTQVPLWVIGPDVPIGNSDALLTNSDLAPTFAELAGAEVPDDVDGRSFAALLRGEPLAKERSRVLLEWFEPFGSPVWTGLRTPTRKYVRYEDGSCRMFRIDKDPYELRNRNCRDGWARRSQKLLDGLVSCSGAECAALEDECNRRRARRCP